MQGWLIYPLDFDPSRRYPMVTIVHGGPSAAVGAVASEAATSARSRRKATSSSCPIRAAVSAKAKRSRGPTSRTSATATGATTSPASTRRSSAAPIDPNRLGLMGWSYGGYMAMWAETQTTRFKAIVAGAGVVNWQSYYGQNKIDQWMIPFFGASVYQDPDVYAKSSPITFIMHSKTPVLILQGERDEEVPAPQAFEFWHAMTTLGVPTTLVVYADEGHASAKDRRPDRRPHADRLLVRPLPKRVARL